MPGTLRMAPVPAKHPWPEIPESETVPRLAQVKRNQKGKSLGEIELQCTVTEGLSNGQTFSPKANLGGRKTAMSSGFLKWQMGLNM